MLPIPDLIDTTISILDSIPPYFIENADTFYTRDISTIEVSPLDSNIIIYATEEPTWGGPKKYKLRKTTDFGDSWIDLSENFQYDYLAITDLLFDPFDPNRIWASCGGYDGSDALNGSNRVFYSPDGGQTWNDQSNGLTAFPVNHLEYYQGSNDIIFAATDAGVYYWNTSNGTWECFNNNLPPAIIKRVEINYCTKELYLGSFGRGAWAAPLEFDFPVELENTMEITSDKTWIHDRFVPHDITIKQGASLTITDSTSLMFAPGVSIHVEPGAKLYINQNSNLTSGCYEKWQGIYVEGDPSSPQALANQGYVSIQNSKIENAHDALMFFGKLNNNYNPDWGKTGGYVSAINSQFINNDRSSAYLSYENTNNAQQIIHKSLYSNCHFEWNDDWPYLTPDNHISMYDVDGIRIQGCSFVNNRSAIGFPEVRRSAIKTIDASLTILPLCGTFNCTNADSSSFENFHVGIETIGISGLNGPRIENVIFKNNLIGISTLGSSMAEITQNKFVTTGNTPFGANIHYGVYSDGGFGSKVEENAFDNSSNSQVKAVYIKNGYNLGNEFKVYRNSFDNSYVGVQTEGSNGNTEIDCNAFDNSGNTAAGIYHATGSLMSQGFCPIIGPASPTDPNANSFLGTCAGSNFEWQVYRNPFTFFDGTGGANQFEYNSYSEASVGADFTNCFSLGVNALNCNTAPIYVYNDACPTDLGSDQEDILNTNLSLMQTNTDILGGLSSQINSGNSIDLIQDIQNYSIADWQIKNVLQEFSPYLSDQVLSTLINSDRPIWVVDEILQLHYPITDRVLKVLYDKTGMPSYMIKEAFVTAAPVETELLQTFLGDESIDQWVIHDVAVANSPLTDKELISFLENNSNTENWVINQVLLQNTPLSDEVEIALTTKPNVAQWVINSVLSSTNISGDPGNRYKSKSELDLLLSEYNHYNVDKLQALNEIIRIYKRDLNLSEIVQILESDGNVEAQCALVPLLIKKDPVKADIHLTNLEAKSIQLLSIDPEDKSGLGLKDFCEFYRKVASYSQLQKGIYSIPENELEYLKKIAESDAPLSIHATVILNELNKKPYSYESLPFLNPEGKKSMNIEESKTELITNALKNYPDPHTGITYIEYKLEQGNGEIVVFDILGRPVKKIIVNSNVSVVKVDLDELNKGVYLYYLIRNNEVIASDKMIIE